MIRSMTGYGRAERVSERCRLVVELKSVNHRNFDLNVRMPKLFNRFEAVIRNTLKQHIQRGKVDLFITWEDFLAASDGLKFNEALAKAYLDRCREMSQLFGIPDTMSTSVLARMPEVFTMEDAVPDEEFLETELTACLHEACGAFVSAREKEGENLKTDILGKLASMREDLAIIEERSPEILAEYRENLRQKVRELLGDSTVDESRIVQEVTIYADRICVDEEMVRLKSHISAMEQELSKSGSIGKQLDFFAQEMNREANTTLSKSSDLKVSDAAIRLKTTIEKIREQVQNIE